MKQIPIELIFIVLFGTALLLNFLMRRAARQQQSQNAQHDEESDEIPEAIWREQSTAVLPPPAPRAAAPARAKVPGLLPAGPRFARRTLLGSRRQVQNAMVVAAILGPCRGDQPH